MNWGNRMIVVFVCFASFIGFMVYKASKVKYDLVTPEYYKDELRYQDRINAQANAAKIDSCVINQDATSVNIILPKELRGYAVEGSVLFYCITDADKDKKFPFNPDGLGQQIFKKLDLSKGPILVKVSCKANSKDYYFEKKIIIK